MINKLPLNEFKKIFKTANILIWLFIATVFAMVLTGQRTKHATIALNNWPGRDYSNWYALSPTERFEQHPDEAAYFREWVLIMNEGITNRMNIQDALDQQMPYDNYRPLFYKFQQLQNNMLNRLSSLPPPQRLREFHRLVVEAGIEQILFYQDYASMRAKQPSFKFNDSLQNDHLKISDQKLHQAYDAFKMLFPSINQQTNDAIEKRLCWFDII